jgi:hypothetical protein
MVTTRAKPAQRRGMLEQQPLRPILNITSHEGGTQGPREECGRKLWRIILTPKGRVATEFTDGREAVLWQMRQGPQPVREIPQLACGLSRRKRCELSRPPKRLIAIRALSRWVRSARM